MPSLHPESAPSTVLRRPPRPPLCYCTRFDIEADVVSIRHLEALFTPRRLNSFLDTGKFVQKTGGRSQLAPPPAVCPANGLVRYNQQARGQKLFR